MRESLHWRTTRRFPEAEAQLQELQTDSLRLFLILTTIAYVAWSLVSVAISPTDEVIGRVSAMFPVAVPLLVATQRLLPRYRPVASVVFVAGGLIAITYAIVAFGSPQPALLYVILALVAAFVIHPAGGFVVVAASSGILGLVGATQPGLIGGTDIVLVVIFGIIAVIGVWALAYHLLLALNWYAEGFNEAERQARDAQEHRAKLVQTVKQLDNAYYRLERANAALQLAWKAADRAERSKMELATNISHELRTPINLIVGYSELMISSPGSYGGVTLPGEYRGDLNAIYRSAQHLLALTDDVLDLAQMDVGRLGLLREPVDLREVIRDATALVHDFVEAKGLTLEVTLPDCAEIVLVDRLRIRQALLNLLTNAARFTERGRIAVILEQRERDVRVSVTDSGPGITEEERRRVFQPFVTSGAKSDWHAGTGLGLPISKRFVELHGGEMDVEAALEGGTTFWFTLPLLPVDRVESTLGVAEKAADTAAGREPILVLAQPGAGLLRLLQRHLEGYRIEAADGLADATARARALRAAAVITDLDTPQEQVPAPVPVVRCALPSARRLAAGLGIADYLAKPVSRETLLKTVARLGARVERILVVDDDDRFARMLCRMLTSAGRDYAVSVAYNGEDALVKMRASPPDLVLLDRAMPGLDGVGVLKEMARDPSVRNVQAIIISAHAEADGAVPLGTEVRIIKPEGYHLIELFQVIGAAVSKLSPSRTHLVADDSRQPVAQVG